MTIPLKWNENERRLTIGKRRGSYRGVPETRKIRVKIPSGEKTITYDGKETSLQFECQ